LAVMKINSDLGYKPVIYSELTQDEEFWNGCKNCVNYEILMKKERKNCLCTAMLFVPDNNKVNKVVNDQPENQYQNEQESNLSV
ncbi:MAG: N-acetyltransferase, partial [Chryseobacterium sp.]